jgi:hypothetical protein
MDAMWLCWPAIAMTMIVIFSLGCCLGRVWEKFFLPNEFEGQMQRMNATEELQQEAMRKKRPLHKEEGGDRAHEHELFGDCESGAEIKVYLTKTGTKVHLINCPGLHNADMTKMRVLAICKHCLKIRKERSLFKAD